MWHKTFDKFQDLKYNRSEENVRRYEELKRRYLYAAHPYVQSRFPYIMPNGEKGFIPKRTVIEPVITIAGAGGQNELRIEERLISDYGGKKGEWMKRVGKVESDKYIFDIHWYEMNGRQYEMKLKHRSEKK